MLNESTVYEPDKTPRKQEQIMQTLALCLVPKVHRFKLVLLTVPWHSLELLRLSIIKLVHCILIIRHDDTDSIETKEQEG